MRSDYIESVGPYHPYTRMPAAPTRTKRHWPNGLLKHESRREFRKRRRLWPQASEGILATNIATVQHNLDAALFSVLRHLQDGSELADAFARTAVDAPDSIISDSFAELARIARGTPRFDLDRALTKQFPVPPNFLRARDLATRYPSYFRLPSGTGQPPVWPRPDQRLRAALKGAKPTASGYRAALEQYFSAQQRGAVMTDEARALSAKLQVIRDQASRLPAELAQAAGVVCDDLDEVLVRLDELDPGGLDLHTVRTTISDDLPETLSLFAALEQNAQNRSLAGDGRKPADVVRAQLAAMRARIQEIIDQLAERDADKLLSHARFIDDKYGAHSNLA